MIPDVLGELSLTLRAASFRSRHLGHIGRNEESAWRRLQVLVRQFMFFADLLVLMIIHRGKKVMKARRDIEVTVSDRKGPLIDPLNNLLP